MNEGGADTMEALGREEARRIVREYLLPMAGELVPYLGSGLTDERRAQVIEDILNKLEETSKVFTTRREFENELNRAILEKLQRLGEEWSRRRDDGIVPQINNSVKRVVRIDTSHLGLGWETRAASQVVGQEIEPMLKTRAQRVEWELEDVIRREVGDPASGTGLGRVAVEMYKLGAAAATLERLADRVWPDETSSSGEK